MEKYLREIVIVPTLPLIRARSDPKRTGGIDGCRRTRTQGQAVNIAVEGVWSKVGKMDPGVAAIVTLVDAIHLDTGPNGAGVSRVNDHVGGTRDADRAGYGDAEG